MDKLTFYIETRAEKNRDRVTNVFLTLIIIVLLAFCLMQAFVKEFFIIGYSMYPTLQPDDRVQATWVVGQPKRGDVVIFPPAPGEQPYIKTVIAVAGDKLYQRGNTVYLYTAEDLAEGANGEAVLNNFTRVLDRKYQEVVPEGYVFVIGDNYNKSYYGLIRIEDIEYKVLGVKSLFSNYLE